MQSGRIFWALLMMPGILPQLAVAEAVSLFNAQMAPRGGLYQASVSPNGAGMRASLFIGRSGASLFADRPAHDPVYADDTAIGNGGRDVDVIRHLIGQAESRRDGYDAVQHGARIKPPKRPTQMTVAEIYAWIAATPGQPHAIGRYQFIPKTLERVVNKLGVDPAQRFSKRMQDRLADVLLAEAGLNRVRAGEISRHAFMNNLAKIWAGLPNSSGKSHYDGYAGNKASMTWARFDAAMMTAFPG